MGLVHPIVQGKIDKKSHIVYAELDVQALVDLPSKKFIYKVPSRYPGMEQDITVRCDRYEQIEKVVNEVNSPLVQKTSVISTFQDNHGKSISVRIYFSRQDRTLTSEEVQKVMDEIISRLSIKGYSLKQ